MEHTELPHRHGNDRDLSRLEHCMQEAESFQAVAPVETGFKQKLGLCECGFSGCCATARSAW